MMSTPPASPAFRVGDEVVLAHGTYQGTSGVFLKLREDVNWADITEPGGVVRSHPVLWLAHAAPGADARHLQKGTLLATNVNSVNGG